MSCPPALINACWHSHLVLAREAVDKDIADVSYHSILWALTYSTENAGNVQTTFISFIRSGQLNVRDVLAGQWPMNECKSFPFSLFLSRRPSDAFFGDGRVREREKEKGVARERRKSFRMLRASTLLLEGTYSGCYSGLAAKRLTVVKAFMAPAWSIQISFLFFSFTGQDWRIQPRSGDHQVILARGKERRKESKFLSH